MLLLSGVLGLEHFRKLFEQIINKHSDGDKTITHTHTHTHTGNWTPNKRTHTHLRIHIFMSQTRHNLYTIHTLSHTHTNANGTLNSEHNILAYVMPECLLIS